MSASRFRTCGLQVYNSGNLCLFYFKAYVVASHLTLVKQLGPQIEKWRDRRSKQFHLRSLLRLASNMGVCTLPTTLNEGGGRNREITGSVAQQRWWPWSAACYSWCIHHPAVIALWANGLQLEQGLEGSAARPSRCICPQQGRCPHSAACYSCCIHHPTVCARWANVLLLE